MAAHELIPIVCPTCHSHLLDAPRGTQACCPKCGVWATASTKDRKDVARPYGDNITHKKTGSSQPDPSPCYAQDQPKDSPTVIL
jgi:predicted RNA-binding Zn-ribbon protein involved in translation (DUF1610 family)